MRPTEHFDLRVGQCRDSLTLRLVAGHKAALQQPSMSDLSAVVNDELIVNHFDAVISLFELSDWNTRFEVEALEVIRSAKALIKHLSARSSCRINE